MKVLLSALTISTFLIFSNVSVAKDEVKEPQDQIKEYKANVMTNLKAFFAKNGEQQEMHVDKRVSESMLAGKNLYTSSGCGSCHPKGDTIGSKIDIGLAKIPIPSLKGVNSRFPQYKAANDKVVTLPEMNNNCLVMFLSKPPLNIASQEALDLANYVATLK